MQSSNVIFNDVHCTISLELKNSMLCLKKTKLRFWDLKCQKCPIDDIGVIVYQVMVGC
jgi:hypothetical protein